MPKRSSIKEPLDVAQIAKNWADELTVDIDEHASNEPESKPAKNPAAVALGRLGGLKGGKARAEKLSAKRLKQIAKDAAKARWSKAKGEGE
jgi:hypothetical protein